MLKHEVRNAASAASAAGRPHSPHTALGARSGFAAAWRTNPSGAWSWRAIRFVAPPRLAASNGLVGRFARLIRQDRAAGIMGYAEAPQLRKTLLSNDGEVSAVST